jgi:YcxB-like protein
MPMTPPPFPILRHTIHLTRGDLLGVMWHLSLRQKSTWIVGTLITGAIAYTMVTGKNPPDNIYEVVAMMIILLLLWCFLPLLGAVISCLTVLASAARQRGVLGLHDYEVREDGLLEKTDVNESLTRWEGLQGVKETRSHLLLRQSPGLIHIIPRRSFTDPQACRHFVDSVRQRISDATKVP